MIRPTAVLFLRSALKGRDGPCRPFRAERQQKRMGAASTRFPWAMPRAVTSQPFRLNGSDKPGIVATVSFLVAILRRHRRPGPGPSGDKHHVPGNLRRFSHLWSSLKQPCFSGLYHRSTPECQCQTCLAVQGPKQTAQSKRRPWTFRPRMT